MRSLLLTLIFVCTTALAGDPSFKLVDGDRVMLLGDTLLERENTFGHLETRMHEQFPAAHFSVRNIAWSAETPLGWSRASFDPAEKGMDRLKEHIALVQPTVAILGFGMAASLQEMTDRSNNWTLNPDPARYGADPMTAARFKKELGELMDTITAVATKDAKDAKVRFILLSPIRHEDLRGTRAGLPDPAAHNALLADYSKAILELATERNTAFVHCDLLKAAKADLTDNGIHLNDGGYRILAATGLRDGLRWPADPSPNTNPALTAAILRKNALWFHRFRPANSTYLFGFRKKEQGKNAVEMEQFTPLLKAADEEIWKLAHPSTAPALASNPQPGGTLATPLPLPTFTLAEGLEISLWADTPMVKKPVQINWDTAGRLWVASTPIYPMIEPGKIADDKIYILEDTDHDGKADKTTIFANGLLIPTCVEPDVSAEWERRPRLSESDGHPARPSSRSDATTGEAPAPPRQAGHLSHAAPEGDAANQPTNIHQPPSTACYVGASTELLYLRDTNGDGSSDQQRIVLSGFGTEDTHHNIHTLLWGPDGLLYFNQSVYTHTHMETPWGVVRVNSGGVISYDPRTERTEVFAKGLWNPWGHQIDKAGQHFLTDGAGSSGLSWAFPGATFAPNEGARQMMGSVSPGSYPKYSGLELIHSPHFPADWQGTAVTCDFRAHKIVHFQITDLSANGTSGYTTKELPVLVQTNDLSFRPIDVKLGPDGALYIADWTNPIINHGEVDFRDPRRDHSHGRIWRISRKGAAPTPLNTRADAGTRPAFTQKDLASDNARTRIEAMRTVARTPTAENAAPILAAAVNAPKEDPFYTFAAWRSVNDIGTAWVRSVLDGKWTASDTAHQQQLEYALRTLPPEQAAPVLAKVLPKPLPADGSGPWIELIGKAGTTDELNMLWKAATEKAADTRFVASTFAALADADDQRRMHPTLPLSPVLDFLRADAPAETLKPAIRLAGAWKRADAVPALIPLARSHPAAFTALRDIASGPARDALKDLAAESQPAPLRASAAIALGTLDFKANSALIFPAIAAQDEKAALPVWRALFATKGVPEQVAGTLPKNLPKPTATAGLAAAREMGKRGDALAKAFAPLAGASTAPAATPADYSGTVDRTKRDGDAARGEFIYRRASLVCTTCHAIGGVGGKVGPDLSSIGASAPLDYLIESLFVPNAKVKEGYNAVLLTQKGGAQISGVLVSENPNEFILRDITGKELRAPKATVTARENLGSIMPAGIIEQLAERERLDLFAFLSTLGKPGAFDSSKATVARQWELWPADPSPIADELPIVKREPGLPTFTLVDGRLPRELIAEKIALLPVGTKSLHARTRFTIPTAGKIKLALTGTSKAWLDRAPLPIASEPSPTVTLTAGEHTLEIELDATSLPEVLKVESQDVTFLGE